MKNQRKKIRAHKPSRISANPLPLRMLAGFEGLEPRQMLAANILGSAEAVLQVPGASQDIELQVGIPESDAGTQAVLLISVDPQSGSTLDPVTPTVTAEGGGTVTPLHSFTNADGLGETIVVSVPSGTHSLQVGGENSTTGGYAINVSLVGDVDTADQQVTEFEDMLATAALLQSSGTGNFVTNHFYWVHGIDVSQDLFDAGFDVNGNGTVDGDDLAAVKANLGIGAVEVELRVDDDGPAFGDVQLVDDSGVSNTDGITTNSAVEVNVTDASPIVRLEGQIDGGAVVEVTGVDLNSGTFILSAATMDLIAGGTLAPGAHTLTLTAVDDLDNESTTSLSFTFIGTNTAPSAGVIATQSTAEDAFFSFDVSSFFTDSNAGDVLTFAGSSTPAWLTVSSEGLLTGTPLNGDVGTDSITVTATDSQGSTAVATFDLTVTNTNDAPVLNSAIPDQNADEDDPFSFDFTSFFSDPDGDTLTFAAVQGTTFSTGTNLPAWLTESNGVLSGTPTAADTGTFPVSVTAVDSTGESVEGNFEITVTNFNDAPTLTGTVADQTVIEDQTLTLDLSSFFSDEDPGDSITFNIPNLPAWLSLNSVTGVLTGTPGDADVGTVTLTIEASDTFNATTSDSFDVTVTNVNDDPVLNNQSFVVDPAESNGFVVGIIDVSDPDLGDTLTYTVVSGDPTSIFAVNSANGAITIADSSQLVEGTFVNLVVSVTDAAGSTDTGTVQINITSNLAPVAVDDDGGNVFDNQTLTINVLGNDTDADGDTLSIQSIDATSQEGATLTLNADGTIEYDPRLSNTLASLRTGNSLEDTFDYVVSDGNGGFDTGTVTVTVDGADVAQYRLEAVDSAGNVVTSVAVGESFTLVAYVRDVQETPEGIFAAFIDVAYPATLASPDGAIVHSSTYPSGTSGTNTTPGLLDEVGGVDGLTPLGGDEFEVFRQEFTADSPGAILFQSNATEDQVQHPTLVFNDNVNLPTSQIIFGATTVTVTGVAPPLSNSAGTFAQNPLNAYDVNNDGAVSPLDALLVINTLETGVSPRDTFTDVNGDTAMSPIDALLVINELVVADAGAAAINGGVQSDVPEAELQSAVNFVFEQLDDDDLSADEIASLDPTLIEAILNAASADESEQSTLWDQLAADIAAALND